MMRIITIAALVGIAGTAGAHAAESDFPMVSVGSARFSGPPDAQGLFTMSVTISAKTCPSMASGSFEIPVSGVHGPAEALDKAKKMVPKLRADLDKDRQFCPT